LALSVTPGRDTPIEQRGFDYWAVKRAWQELTKGLKVQRPADYRLALYRLGADPQNPDFAPSELELLMESQGYKSLPVDLGEVELPRGFLSGAAAPAQ